MSIKKHLNKKTIFSFIAIAIFLLSICGYNKINAQQSTDNKVSIIPKNNDKSLGTFGDGDGFWYPGRTLSKQFVIKNNYNDEIEFDKISVNIQSVDNYILNKVFNPDEDIYKEFLKNLKVLLKDGDNVIFEGTFEEFNKNGVLLKTPMKISGNSQKELTITLHFEEAAGNIFQNLRHSFNLSIQYVLKDGTAVDQKITSLPQTGGFLNVVTLLVIGLLFSGIGFLILGHKEETSLKGGGSSNAK